MLFANISDYSIIAATDLYDFEIAMKECIDQGWQPVGQMQIGEPPVGCQSLGDCQRVYYQTIVKYKEQTQKVNH